MAIMNGSLTILGIPGGLRKASYNRAALRAAQQLAPEGVKIEIFDLAGIPLYNQDDEKQPPERVIQLREKIRAADAILFATPEFNYSIPAALKNAIEWASRPYGQNSWEGKPVAVMGASPAVAGTARAQYHLRQIFVDLNVHALTKPELMIGTAHQLFDAEGNLTDEKTRQHIRGLVQGLVQWTRRLEKGRVTA